MQINIDTSKLPAGTTAQEVYETIVCAMGGYIGDYEGYSDVDEEKVVLSALVEPARE